MLTAIASSHDLAVVLNAVPATEADAAETPRDWLAGIWVAGTVYPLDAAVTTDTRAVLADGTAAVEFSPAGDPCLYGRHGNLPASFAAHWCAADVDSWTAGGDARGVVRDWRSVSVWDANGYAETTVHDTIEQARAAFDRESAELQKMTEELAADLIEDADDEF
jgi:hypothetical protein